MPGMLQDQGNPFSLLGCIIVLAALALASVSPATAQAQEPLPEPHRETAGPYEISDTGSPLHPVHWRSHLCRDRG